jgi:hypothetical protein
MISRRTIIWFALLAVFTSALEVRNYQEQRPCREWKAAHRNQDAKQANALAAGPDESVAADFNPCTLMWEAMPVWVKLCAIGWLVSAVGFIVSFIRDVWRWVRRRWIQRQQN